MGYLTEKLFKQVNHIAQERGRSYFVNGRVKVVEGDSWRANAKVQGSSLYGVGIVFEDDFLDVQCSCPFFEREMETCKHIWAALLAMEQQGLLKVPGTKKSLRIFESYALYDDEDDDNPITRAGGEAVSSHGTSAARHTPPPPDWKHHLQTLRSAMESAARPRAHAPAERELLYCIDVGNTLERQRLIVEVAQRERKMNGSWGKLKSRKFRSEEIDQLPDPMDRRILAILLGARQEPGYGYPSYYYNPAPAQYMLPVTLWEVLLPLMCGTGRCVLCTSTMGEGSTPLAWDDGEPWELCLNVAPDSGGNRYQVTGSLRREGRQLDVTQPILLLAGGLVFLNGRVARLEDHGAFGWIALLRARESLSFAKEESESFLDALMSFPRQPRWALPQELEFETISVAPTPRLVIKAGKAKIWSRARLVGELSFDYDGTVIPHQEIGPGIYQKDRRRLVTRDVAGEETAKARLKQMGFRKSRDYGSEDFELLPDHLPKVVRVLANEGWHIEAEGDLYRTAGALRMEIKSGVDWFELEGGAQFGEAEVALPRLLRAIKHGESTVRLDDGTLGIIPEDWLKKYGLLAGLGSADEDRLRFARPQAGLLDALLASEPAVTCDAAFERLRRELRSFSGVSEALPTAQFEGELRSYQREGLGWLFFLQRFGFGGCLADDMGLGKTIQVLALLESRREPRAGDGDAVQRPSLVVVPRSLVFHWKKEAARFAPGLRVLDHTGGARLKPGDHFEDYDVILTTYGTLRRDAMQFKDQRFDYCILDEAQAIKNAGTLSAKAVRLLSAGHRLAMSGTPVENHLGELWSLFEFLNPGMLGSASILANAGRNPDGHTRAVLGKALRPFILRRTKGQVATELPEKTEQTIYCDLESKDKKLYNELRDYYRSRLLKNGAGERTGQFKIQVLEALLRLRQAACHPGLIDKRKVEESSAKIDTLVAQLDQVLEENHKSLVFSQFTSLLAILRGRLDRNKIPYVYLDGRTRDREARVEQFQNDPNAKLFLISLKAGGLGLNLHAAEYVYLLDPWWNPAVEAQAIDRAHRIGQTRPVFAYRIIARDTVEEKVIELQKSKRDLADAIISADNSLIRNLTREDLEVLLA
jgi:SNF2-related domain/Helicase conserved C-terminal domain/SWIM zinc finger